MGGPDTTVHACVHVIYSLVPRRINDIPFIRLGTRLASKVAPVHNWDRARFGGGGWGGGRGVCI